MIQPLPAAPVSICRLVKSFAYDAATDHYIVAVVPDIGNLISAPRYAGMVDHHVINLAKLAVGNR